jgi:hypothetical protein
MSRSLYDLLSDSACSEEALLQAMHDHPGALRLHFDENGSLPIHIECRNQCRSSVLVKCIELYPESLTVADGDGYWPLHAAIKNKSASFNAIMTLIDGHPGILRKQDNDGCLPLHIACQYTWHPMLSSIIAKLIELYPGSLAVTDRYEELPLHYVISNPSSPVEIALLLTEKYPQVLRHADRRGQLPIHIECWNQCRASIISKYIEVFPESAGIRDDEDHIPWTRALNQVANYNIYGKRTSLLILLSAYPAAFYHPPNQPMVDKLAKRHSPRCRRLILNLLPSCLSSAAHLQAYHDLNWQPRLSLLHLWLQIRLKSRA